MTVTNTAATETFSGNGITTAFSFSFVAVSVNNLVVLYTAANGTQSYLTLNVDYTVSLNAPPSGQLWGLGGTINYPINGAALPIGASLTVSRLLALEQTYTISNQGDFYAQVVERALDVLCMMIQQTALVSTHALTYNFADPGPFQSLPIGAAARANQFVYFDSSGNLTVAQGVASGGVISAAMQPVCDAATIADAVTLLGIDISLAMEPIVSAATIVSAVQLLGLSLGLTIPCTATISGTSISLTRNSNTNPVAAELLGLKFSFTMPSGATGPFSIAETTDSLSGGTLFDSYGNDILQLNTNQYCEVAWSPVFSGWVLINYSPKNPSGYIEDSTSGYIIIPNGVNLIGYTACAGGGGGGWCSNSGNAGGAGGGGGQYVVRGTYSVNEGDRINWTVGAGGTGGTGSGSGAATAGGNTTIVDATSSVTIATLIGGGPGGAGTSTSATTGGSATSPALAGQNGAYFGGPGFSFAGAGGGSLAPGGAGVTGGGNGQTPGGFGGGGGGGCPSGQGANGAGGFVRIWWEWT